MSDEKKMNSFVQGIRKLDPKMQDKHLSMLGEIIDDLDACGENIMAIALKYRDVLNAFKEIEGADEELPKKVSKLVQAYSDEFKVIHKELSEFYQMSDQDKDKFISGELS